MKKTTISIDVSLDVNQVPEKLSWSAPDGGVSDQEAAALFMSTWDKDQQESARIDLWTKEMPSKTKRNCIQKLQTYANSWK